MKSIVLLQSHLKPNAMKTLYETPVLIGKEQVTGLKFPSGDVLVTSEQQAERRRKLDKGMILGNNHKHKVKIVFEDAEGIKKVETTIWAAMEKNISLKGGKFIPIRRIHDVII